MFTFLQNVSEYIIPFLIVLTILVFIHELGHYLVARWNGVKVEVFSIGFGPEIFGFNDKTGTRWKFSIIPLGGYVRMYGDENSSSKADNNTLDTMSEEERSKTLHGKRVGQKMAVVAAGPFANYIFAIVIMTFLFAIKGIPVTSNVVGDVSPTSVAEQIGLKAQDRIIKINETTIANFNDIKTIIPELSGQEISIAVQRQDNDQPIILSGKMIKENEPVSQLGVRPSGIEYQPQSTLTAVSSAFKLTYTMTVETLKGIGQMIAGKRSAEEMGGTLAIADMATQSAKSGIAALFWFMAILSINLGLINLFPIPVLDGGHLLMFAVEGIRGKPVSVKAQEIAFTIGFIIIMGIMIMTTWNDLIRYKVFSWLKF